MLTWLRREKVLDNLIQGLALALVVGLLVGMFLVARHNLDTLGITSGFGFLDRTTGWDISFSLIDYSIRSTYRDVLLVGFLNTLLVGLVSLVLATVLGTTIGMARVSHNMTLRIIGTAYVEVFRNVPLLLQALFWYAIMTHLPTPRQAEAILGGVFVTARGLYFPFPALAGAELAVCLLLSAAIVGGAAWLLRAKGARLGIVRYWLVVCGALAASLAVFVLVPAINAEPGAPLLVYPELKGLRIKGGLRLIPELTTLIIALVVFGGAYIGEIVRGGLLSVGKGQLEAATALGLSPMDVYWKVRFPLALRAIVPPLGNQYVWLLKGTTIGLAIGFSDLFMVSSTSINQSGQSIEILGIMMLGFWVINFTIGTLMNWLNKAIALKGHGNRG